MAAITRRFTFGMGDRNPETGSARDQAARLASAIREVLGGDVSQVEVTGAVGAGRNSCFGTWFALDGYLFAGVEKSALGECDWSSGIGATLTCQRFSPSWWRDLDLPAYLESVREELEMRIPDKWLAAERWKGAVVDDQLAPSRPAADPDAGRRLLCAIRDAFGADGGFDYLLPAPASPDDPVYGVSFVAFAYLSARVEACPDGLLRAWVDQGEAGRLPVLVPSPRWDLPSLDLPAYAAAVREELELRVPDKWLSHLTKEHEKRRPE